MYNYQKIILNSDRKSFRHLKNKTIWKKSSKMLVLHNMLWKLTNDIKSTRPNVKSNV